MILDMHTHYGACFEERDGADPARWLSALDAAQVDGAVVCGDRALRAAYDVAPHNDFLAKVVSAAPGRMVGFGTVHPFAGRPALDEAERCLRQLAMKGLKLHPWLQGFPSSSSAELHDLCELCASEDRPILFHDGTPNLSMPAQIGLLAHAHPRTSFILGHSGLMHLWREAAEVGRQCKNVYLVLCGPHPAALRFICRRVPSERLLWGTDYGFGFENWIPYRKELIGLLALAEADRGAIMGENAARLLRWRPSLARF